jgi:hypothetical protein
LSLVVAKPGPKKGVRLLPGEIELRIEAAIDAVFKQPERPTLEKLRRDIRKDCDAAGLKPPSRKAQRRHGRSLLRLVLACGRPTRWAWPMHGIAKSLHLDNGKEFHSKALKRGCQQHGIRIDYRPPATPRFGGHIERLMGTLMTRVHALPGTTSSNVAARRDYPAEQKAILTLREFERILALEILGHTTTRCIRRWASRRQRPGPRGLPRTR